MPSVSHPQRIILACLYFAASFLLGSPPAINFVSCFTPTQLNGVPFRSRTRHGPTTSRSILERRSQKELGDLAAPKPPDLDDALIGAARAKLSWEVFADKNDPSQEDGAPWEAGELWAETRLSLVKMWVLPRDMSNGASESYAKAAGSGESKMLVSVPQLVRLPPTQVIASAKLVLKFGLPPALLRSEPVLLSFPPTHIEKGFEFLSAKKCLSEKAAVEACRDTPGLLVKSVEDWMQEV